MQITSGLPEGFNAGAYDMIVVGAGYAGADNDHVIRTGIKAFRQA